MKIKRVLKFYFNAENLNSALDNLILACAYRSAEAVGKGEEYAERILELISAKESLAGLWAKIDGVMAGIGAGERKILMDYARMRVGIRHLGVWEQKKIRSAVMKFTRHARNLESCAEGLALVSEYYCLL